MGCDIHVFVEAKFDKQWHPLRTGPMYYWNGKDLKSDASDISDKYTFYYMRNLGRDYTLFGLLAGVRNGSIKPLKQPIGYPGDMSMELRKELVDNVDLHTPTYYGVKELVDGWDKTGYKRYMATQTWGPDRTSESPIEDPALIAEGRELLEIFPDTELRFIICFDN